MLSDMIEILVKSEGFSGLISDQYRDSHSVMAHLIVRMRQIQLSPLLSPCVGGLLHDEVSNGSFLACHLTTD